MRAKLIVIERLGRGGGGGGGEQAMNLQQVANGCEKEGDKAKRGSKAAAMRIRTISDIKKSQHFSPTTTSYFVSLSHSLNLCF